MILSGSIIEEKEEEEKKEETITIEELFNIPEVHDALIESFAPTYILSGKGKSWFVCAETHSMIRVALGTEVFIIDSDEENSKLLVGNTSQIFWIPEDLIEEVGWN
jgi:hypothetical protein